MPNSSVARDRSIEGEKQFEAHSIIDNAFMRLEGCGRRPAVFLKCEGFNVGGSIKMKTALAMLNDLERRGKLKSSAQCQCAGIIESSSGNLGIALSIVCRSKGIRFICVTDPNATERDVRFMRSYGATVIVITERDENGGYLNSRIRYIEAQLAQNQHLIWPNQYANPVCKEIHKQLTGPAILSQFQRVDYLFVGAGTTGTLMGCCEYFQEHSPATKVVGVDSVGSITFGNAPCRRYIPGLGSSRVSELFDRRMPHCLIEVPEEHTIAVCREVRDRFGLMIGGSSGTVLAGIEKMANQIEGNAIVVAISPDFGDRYLDTIYSDDWVASRFPQFFKA